MAGIYLHIPFCKQACNYCNFHFSTSLKLKDNFLQALHVEMAMRQSYLEQATIDTIYIGGGSPSLLSSEELLRLFDALAKYFPHQELKEITLEANPDDLSTNYLRQLKNTPINRLSIGVQSFRPTDLLFMNRAHTADQADYAIKAAQGQGFENMSIDLIYGTPGLSDAQWKANIQKAISMGIPHISSYALTVEPRTALAAQIAKGQTPAPTNQQAAQQMMLLMEIMEQGGYEHYEISNFALPGKYAIHNTNYWKSVPYLGLGPSAHSFDGNSRQWNIANNALYINELLEHKQVPFERELLSENDQLNEYLMTSLRTMWGCDLTYIHQQFGAAIATQIKELAAQHIERQELIVLDNHLVLTATGKLRADNIAASLFRI